MNGKPIRFPTLCSFCAFGCTLSDGELKGGLSWCSNDKYKSKKGQNNWAAIFQCSAFEGDRFYYAGEIKHWLIFWSASTQNNLEIQKSIEKLQKEVE